MAHIYIWQDILFVINVQHDCARANCTASGRQCEVQERQLTNRVRHTIEHRDDTHYIVNLHALHNSYLLQRIFRSSPDLVMSKPVTEDRQALHIKLSTQLRTLDVVKKTAAREKREMTKRRKAAEKAAGVGERMTKKQRK